MHNGFSLRRLGIGALLILSLILVALPLAAQDALTEVYVTEDESLAFLYPQGWFIDDSDPDIIVVSDNAATLESTEPVEDSVLVGVVKPSFVSGLASGSDGDLEAILSEFIEMMELPEADMEEMELGDRTIVVSRMVIEEYPSALAAMPLSNGDTVLFMAVVNGEFTDFEPTIVAIAETVDTFDPMLHTLQAEAPAEPCVVTAEKAGAAALRVGPGFNRTELSSLAPDQPFTVLGEAEADDGSLWWKLDKEEALPQSAAAEIWVNQDDVVASGGCTAIGEAEAPPIVPITAPQPEAVNTATTGEAPVVPAGGAAAAAGTGLFISLPEWHNQLPANLKASSSDSAKYLAGVTVQFVSLEKREYERRDTGEKKEFHRYRIDYDVTVTVRETGQQIARQTFQGGNPPPFQGSLALSATLNGDPPEFAAALPWFQAVAGQ